MSQFMHAKSKEGSPSSETINSEQKRYTVTLNTPTAPVRKVKDLPISYIDQDVVYHLSILDTGASCGGAYTYHTVVRVCREDDQLQQSSRASTPSRKPTKDGAYTIEYAPSSQDSGNRSPIQPILHSCFRDSFSVTWSSNAVTGGSYCLIPVKLRTAGTQQSANLKLYVGTERIRAVDATVSMAELYQESFARVKLFTQKDAQNEHAQEIANIERNLTQLEIAIAQARTVVVDPSVEHSNICELKTLRDRSEGKTPPDNHTPRLRGEDAEELENKLVAARKVVSSVRPVQVFRLVVPDDGELKPFHIPSEQKKSSKHATIPASVRKDRKRDKATSLLVPQERPSKVAKATLRRSPAFIAQSRVSVARNQPPPPPLAAPLMCFYIRPEHLPHASYRAVYPGDQSYAGLLMSISSKFELDIGEIGLIYFYNGNLAPVVVDEASFPNLNQEQDLIVQFPFAVHSSSGQTTQPLINMLSEYPHNHGFDSVYDQKSAHKSNDSSNMFEQYLSQWTTLRQDDSYGDSVDSWSEITDEMSMKNSSTRCSTAQTSMPSEDISMDTSYIHNRIAMGTEIIDQVNYSFDGSTFAFSQPQAPESVYSMTSEDTSNLRSQSTATPIQSTATSEKIFKGRKGKASANTMPPVMDSLATTPESNMDSDAMSSSKDALEKNRVAAAKCRLSRKAREHQLVEKSQEKAEQNAKLRKEVSSLEAQIREVRDLLAAHNTCA